MKKFFTCEMKGDAEHHAVAEIAGRDDSKRLKEGHEKFAPMYLIRQEDGDPKKLEMCACLVYHGPTCSQRSPCALIELRCPPDTLAYAALQASTAATSKPSSSASARSTTTSSRPSS